MALIVSFYLVAINFAACYAFILDKAKARAGYRRIPERTLLQLALLGGTVGAFAGQRIARHKTRKEPFRTFLNTIALVQLLVVVGISSAVVVLGPAEWVRLWSQALA